MRTLLVLIGFTLMVAVNTAMAGAADVCLKCHGADADFSLAGEGADQIAESMKVIRDGNVKHSPGLESLSDEDIATISAALNGG
jgi:cytochrome c553